MSEEAGPVPDPYWDYEDNECGTCGGEGFVYGCSWDWQCDTYDEGEGTCLCTRPCDWCSPSKPNPELQAVLAEALARDRDGARSAETACPAPVPQDRHARAEGIAPTHSGVPIHAH